MLAEQSILRQVASGGTVPRHALPWRRPRSARRRRAARARADGRAGGDAGDRARAAEQIALLR